MQLDKFVESLPYDTFAELMRACTVRMVVELSKLEKKDEVKSLPASPPAPKSTVASRPSTSTSFSKPISGGTKSPGIGSTYQSSPARQLLNLTPNKRPIPTDVVLTEEEKRLAREEGKIKAIKALKKRFTGSDHQPKYTLLQCKGIVEAFMEKEGIPPNAHHKSN